jgi:hypothetical protein
LAPQASATFTIPASPLTTGAGMIAALAVEARPNANAPLKTSVLIMMYFPPIFVAAQFN